MSSVTPFPTNSLFRFPFKGDALDQYTWHLLTFINNPPSCGLALTIPLDVVSPVHTNGTRGVLNAIDTHWPLPRSKSTLTGYPRWYFVLRLGSAKYLLVAVFVGLHELGLGDGEGHTISILDNKSTSCMRLISLHTCYCNTFSSLSATDHRPTSF